MQCSKLSGTTKTSTIHLLASERNEDKKIWYYLGKAATLEMKLMTILKREVIIESQLKDFGKNGFGVLVDIQSNLLSRLV